MIQALSRFAFNGLSVVGRPFGGVRPRRMYHALARRGFRSDQFRWHRDEWGNELRLCPYYLLDRTVIAFGSHDRNLNCFLEGHLKEGMICFDIGANIGEVSLHMARKVAPSGKVYAFDPAPWVFQRLSEHIARNQLEHVIRPSRIALSRETGTTCMTFADASYENQGQGSIVNLAQQKLKLTQEVETVRIDDFVARNNIDRIDVMKIDIQGAEVLLLEGGPKVFGQMSPDLLIELSPTDLSAIGKNSHDLVSMIRGYGYEVFELHHSGRLGSRLPQRVAPDLEAPNVFCTKRPPPASV